MVSKWTVARSMAALLLPAMLLGCQVNREYAEPSGTAAATRPSGRDLDQEKVHVNRRLSSLSDSTIRVYEYPDGKLVLDERLSFADRQGLMAHLGQMNPRHQYQGIVYFISRGDIQDKAAFAAIKAFCIGHNVNLYISEGSWARRKSAWQTLGETPEEVVWIVKSRP